MPRHSYFSLSFARKSKMLQQNCYQVDSYQPQQTSSFNSNSPSCTIQLNEMRELRMNENWRPFDLRTSENSIEK